MAVLVILALAMTLNFLPLELLLPVAEAESPANIATEGPTTTPPPAPAEGGQNSPSPTLWFFFLHRCHRSTFFWERLLRLFLLGLAFWKLAAVTLGLITLVVLGGPDGPALRQRLEAVPSGSTPERLRGQLLVLRSYYLGEDEVFVKQPLLGLYMVLMSSIWFLIPAAAFHRVASNLWKGRAGGSRYHADGFVPDNAGVLLGMLLTLTFCGMLALLLVTILAMAQFRRFCADDPAPRGQLGLAVLFALALALLLLLEAVLFCGVLALLYGFARYGLPGPPTRA
jgi:hypothetical protein